MLRYHSGRVDFGVVTMFLSVHALAPAFKAAHLHETVCTCN